MNQQKTVEKVTQFLFKLYILTERPAKIALADMLQENSIPRDYGKILIEAGVIEKFKSGQRGPMKYRWVGKDPNEALAIETINGYNRLRNSERWSKSQTQQSLIEIKEMLREILTIVKPTTH